MASSSTSLPLFFLLAVLFSLQIHARESQFFSKITRDRGETSTVAANNNYYYNNAEEESKTTSPVNAFEKDEQKPTFAKSGYGHETGLFPPSTTTTTTRTTVPMDTYENKNNYYSADNNKNNDRKNYATMLKGLSETRYPNDADNFQQKDNNYYDNNRNNNGQYSARGYGGGVERHGMSDTRFMENGKYFYDINGEKKPFQENYKHGGVERQGMSDTRFMENGKYFYDVNGEKKPYDPNYYNYQNNRGVNMRRNYFNNDNTYSYNNNVMQSEYQYQPEDEEFELDEP